MPKFPLRSSMKASFLHDEDIDWEEMGLLEKLEEDDAEADVSERGEDAELDKSELTKSEASKTNGSDRRTAWKASSGRTASSDIHGHASDHFDSERTNLSSSSGSSSSGSFYTDPASRFGLGRQASSAILTASSSGSRQSPHELAADVAKNVKATFEKNLPSALAKEFDQRDVVAPYSGNEIVLGPHLGSGEFSNVYEIKAFRPNSELESKLLDEQRDEEVSTRRHMKRRGQYRDTKKARYAIKHLKPDLVERYGRLEYAQAASDLALEAEFLSSLQHPNIIKLRGISYAGAGGFENGPKGYFLIIDRLDETLNGRIKRWRKARKGGLRSSLQKKVKGLQRLGSRDENGTGGGGKGTILEEQVDCGLRIASALVYLHERNIMFRDLKPPNIGFDVRGDVKIFDFGLASVIPESNFIDPYADKFEMSGAGSPRYMAPEVLVDPPEKYNLKADVYTFAIVLWEILSLEIPYSHIKSRDQLVDYVINEVGRPEISDGWPDSIKVALQKSFDPVIDRRPSMQVFYNTLRFQLLGMRDGDDSELSNTQIKRRRSFESMRNLGLNLDGTALEDDEGQDGQNEQSSPEEKFPQRVRNTIIGRVGRRASDGDDDDDAVPLPTPQPARRRRATGARLREKFRLSVKHESPSEG